MRGFFTFIGGTVCVILLIGFLTTRRGTVIREFKEVASSLPSAVVQAVDKGQEATKANKTENLFSKVAGQSCEAGYECEGDLFCIRGVCGTMKGN